MGNEKCVKIPTALIDYELLTDSEKIFLMRVFYLSEEKGFCYASDEELAKLGGYSERTVRRLISGLTKSKCLLIDKKDTVYKRRMVADINDL